MRMSKTLLALGVASALLVGCKKQDDSAAADTATAAADANATQTESPAVETSPAATEAPAAKPAVVAFDIGKIPVSDKPLPAWPYIALPAGYHYHEADDLAGQSKDLARIPVWTGGQLLWVEGKTFSDGIDNADGKTFSRFELAKGLLMKMKSCNEEEAYTLMRRQAMSRQQKLIQVAEQIIAMHDMLGN